MILRETSSSLVLINQHDHAQLAAQLAAHWNPAYVRGHSRWPEVLHAIAQHDRGWIYLDQQLIWDDAGHKPCSFTDYPLRPKLAQYIRGIDEVAQTNAYGALLCSLHYTSFPDLETTAAGRAFKRSETERQQLLQETLQLYTPSAQQDLQFHLHLLKFCDGLSIYLCINEPGMAKAQEHPWYRSGIPYSSGFDFVQGHNIQASWHGTSKVQVSPYPFERALILTIPFRLLRKDHIRQLGGPQVLQQASFQQYQVQLAP